MNAAQTSTRPDFGVLEQYLGFRVGDASNVSHGKLQKFLGWFCFSSLVLFVICEY